VTYTEPTRSPEVSGASERVGPVRSIVRGSWKMATRLGWGLLDQGLSSLTNFALGVIIARNVSPRDFGAFAIAFGVYTAGLGLTRAISSEPLMVRYSVADEERWRMGARTATGTALWIGIVLGLACLSLGAVVHDAVMSTGLKALGVMLPGLLVQDTWRFAFFARRRGSAAFVNDLAWAIGLVGSLGWVLWTGRDSVGWLVLAWGGSGSMAAAFGCVQAGLMPAPTRVLAWFREQRDLVPRFVGEFGITTLAAQLSIFAIAAVAGLAAVGAIRAGQLLFGPLNVIYMGAAIAGLPEAVRLLRSSTTALRRACLTFSIGLATSSLGVGVVASLLPSRIGVALLGESWPAARTVIFPISIWMAAFGASLGAGIGLRALAAARLSLRARMIMAPISIALSVAGAAVGGARGAAWGAAAAVAFGAIVWWRYLRRGLREYEPVPHGEGTAADGDAMAIREGRDGA
jgi:O-antigen/teichoic acid export membrane protein